MGQASRHKRLQSSRAYPDLFVAHPRQGFSGLYLELKKPGSKIFKTDGTLYSDPHIREQAEMLQNLRGRGYTAFFAVGFDEAKSIIDHYLTKSANQQSNS